MMSELDGYTLAYITYRDVGIENLHKFFIGHNDNLIPNAKESNIPFVLLETCNRIEIYSYGVDPREFLKEFYPNHPFIDKANFLKGKDVFIHLTKVASGLDSLATGEPQILGQVRRSYINSRRKGIVNRQLVNLFDNAIRIARKVRRSIKGRLPDYIEISRDIIERSGGRRILIVGTGDMANDLSSTIRGLDAEIYIASRSMKRAKVTADRYGFKAIELSKAIDVLEDFDVVVTCTTAKEPVLTDELLKKWNGSIIIDLGMPPNTELKEPGKFEFYDLIKLSKMIEGERSKYSDILGILEEKVGEEVDMAIRKLAREGCEEVISQFYRRAENIRRLEVDEALDKIRNYVNGDTVRVIKEIIDAMSFSIIKKIYHPYALALRKADNGYRLIDILRSLEKLDGDIDDEN